MCGAQNLGALRKPVAPTLAWCLGWWWSGGDETGPVSPHLNMLPMFLDAGFSFFFKFLVTYFWLCWVSVAAWTPLVAESGAPLQWQCVGFSLWRRLLLWSTGSVL